MNVSSLLPASRLVTLSLSLLPVFEFEVGWSLEREDGTPAERLS